MISRIAVRQSLKILASALFLLLCCSISAFAQSPSDAQGAAQIGKMEIKFKDTPVKTAITTLAKQENLNIVFDEAVRDFDKLTLELKDVTIEQALKICLVAKRLQARIIEEKTIIVFPDNATNRERYGQYEIWPAKSNETK